VSCAKTAEPIKMPFGPWAARSVGLSSVTVVSKNATELIEVPFRMLSWVAARNHVLDGGGGDSPMGTGHFEGGDLL